MRIIPFLASLSGCIAELQTQCTSDDQYIVSLPYTIQNSTLLSATAGICSEKNITYAQDVATFNVTIDINRCKLNTKTYPKPKVQAKNLFMANITNLKVGRTGNGMSFTYLDMDIATECGRQMSYEITHEYGAIASAGSLTPDVGVNETDVILPGAKAPFTFSFQEYTNLFFNETRATGPRQAGTKSFVKITATNMDVSEYSFHVPSCKVVTTTGKEQALFRSLSEENSFIDLYKGYHIKNRQQEFRLSHIFFVLDRNSTARYNLTCNVRVCAKNYLGESCDIVQSCSTNPCVHGTCQDTLTWQTGTKKTDYSCTCRDNYEGTNCDQAKGKSATYTDLVERDWTQNVDTNKHCTDPAICPERCITDAGACTGGKLNHTVMFWMEITGATSNANGDNVFDNGYHSNIRCNGWVMYFRTEGGYKGNGLKGSYCGLGGFDNVKLPADMNKWIHVAVVHNEVTGKIISYQNGNQQMETNTPDYQDDCSRTCKAIYGGSRHGKPFVGKTKGLRIFKRQALTKDEIVEFMNK